MGHGNHLKKYRIKGTSFYGASLQLYNKLNEKAAFQLRRCVPIPTRLHRMIFPGSSLHLIQAT
jgi:hypothetical protein